MAKLKITLTEGMNGNYFCRDNGVLVAGFVNEEDAIIFVKAKYGIIIKKTGK